MAASTSISTFGDKGVSYLYLLYISVVDNKRDYLLGDPKQHLAESALSKSLVKVVHVLNSSCVNQKVFHCVLPLEVIYLIIYDKDYRSLILRRG